MPSFPFQRPTPQRPRLRPFRDLSFLNSIGRKFIPSPYREKVPRLSKIHENERIRRSHRADGTSRQRGARIKLAYLGNLMPYEPVFVQLRILLWRMIGSLSLLGLASFSTSHPPPLAPDIDNLDRSGRESEHFSKRSNSHTLSLKSRNDLVIIPREKAKLRRRSEEKNFPPR